MARRELNDPVGVFRFVVEVDGLQVGGFSEVSGLDVELETEKVLEGGLNNYVHHLPKRVSGGKLILKRGIVPTDSGLLNWFNDCINGAITRKSGIVMLLNLEGLPVREWVFYGAYPVKVIGPQLNAQGQGSVAIETIELVYGKMHVYPGG